MKKEGREARKMTSKFSPCMLTILMANLMDIVCQQVYLNKYLSVALFGTILSFTRPLLVSGKLLRKWRALTQNRPFPVYDVDGYDEDKGYAEEYC